MTFSAFTKRLAAFAAAVFLLLLCASAPSRDFVPMEDVTKLVKPTICIGRGQNLRLIDWDGQNERVWMTGDFNHPARFSRDGKRAAISASTDGSFYTLFILELETGRLINMTERLKNNRKFKTIYIPFAVWFPDGRRLACGATDTTDPFPFGDIYVLDIGSATLEQLTKTPTQDEYWPSVSGDGKKIVYYSTPSDKERADLGGLPKFSNHLYTMNADGSNVVNLTYSAATEMLPEWSPDGKKIAFQAYDRKEQEGEIRALDLFMMDPDGSNVERLTSRKDGLEAWGGGDWSADSKWILFHMKLEDNLLSGLYRIHIDTREIVRIGRYGAATWVHAGNSRFLSVDPAGKKKAPWGALKAADSSPNSPTPQDSE